MGKREYKHWTMGEIKMAVDMRKQGISATVIGEKLGRSTDTVKMKLSACGYRINPRKRWTKEEWEEAQSLRATDMMYKDIGDILGRDKKDVNAKFWYMRNKSKKRSVVNE